MMYKKKKDYCTLFFEKIGDYDISGCCKMHDEDYENQLKPRKEADKDLRLCVNRVSHSKVGNVMLVGVRLAGWIFWYWHKFSKYKKSKKKSINTNERERYL